MNWLADLKQTKDEVSAEIAAIEEQERAAQRARERAERSKYVRNLCIVLEWLGVPTSNIPVDYSRWTGEGEPPVDFLPVYVAIDGYKFGLNFFREGTWDSGETWFRFRIVIEKESDIVRPPFVRTPIHIEPPVEPRTDFISNVDQKGGMLQVTVSDEDTLRHLQASLAEIIEKLDAKFAEYEAAVANWNAYVAERINQYAHDQAVEQARREERAEAERAYKEEQRARLAELEEYERIEEEKRAAHRAEIASAFGVSPGAWDHLIKMVAESLRSTHEE